MPNCEVIVKYIFGSAAWGDAGEVNDIDLLIVKKNVPYHGADRIRELYHLVDAEIAVDFLVYTPQELERRLALGDPFIRNVVSLKRIVCIDKNADCLSCPVAETCVFQIVFYPVQGINSGPKRQRTPPRGFVIKPPQD